MKKILQNLTLNIFLVLFSLLIFSCNEDAEQLGGGLIPDSKYTNAKDTVLSATSTLFLDPSSINKFSGLTKSWLGSVESDDFGLTDFSTAMQLIPSGVVDTFSFGEEPLIDSVILTLGLSKFVAPDTVNAKQKINVYEIAKSTFYNSEIKFVNDEFKLTNVNLLGSSDVSFYDFRDSVKGKDTTLAFNKIKLKLDNSNFEKLIDVNLPVYTFQNSASLQSLFAGIYIERDEASDKQVLSQIKLDATSNINIYYTNKKKREDNAKAHPDSLSNYSLSLSGSNSQRNAIITKFTHPGEIGDDIDKEVRNLFSQTLGGVETKLSISGLKELRSKIAGAGNIIVHKATISVPYDTTKISSSYYSKVQGLDVYVKNSKGERLALPYKTIDSQRKFYNGAVYESSTKDKAYENRIVMNLANYFQGYFDGKVDYDEFYLVPFAEKDEIRILKMFNEANSDNNRDIRFELVYSKIN